MATNSQKRLAWVAAGTLMMGLWQFGPNMFDAGDETASAKHLVNQVWLERMPTDERDVIGQLILIRHPQGRVGAVGRSSAWRYRVEAFKWGLEGDHLQVFFPQDRVKAAFHVRTWKCKGEAPKPFELCLEVSAGERKATYYSREEWVIEPHQLDETAETINGQVPGLSHVLSILDTPPQTSDAESVEFDGVQNPELLDRLSGLSAPAEATVED